MILILGHPADETCKGVFEEALRGGIPALWWNPLFPTSFEVENYSCSGILNRLNILSWNWDRPIKKKDRNYVYQEWSAALLSFLKRHANCVNPPHAPYLNSQHLPFAKQFEWAKECPLAILKYLFTSDPKEARGFAEAMKGKIIIRQDPDDYRDFACAPSVKTIFKTKVQKMYYLVEWPEGTPHFYHQVGEDCFFSRGYGAKQHKSNLPESLKKPLKELAKKSGASFVECLLFKKKKGGWAFGFISPFPEESRYLVHQEEIHKSLLKLLVKNKTKGKPILEESFIPKSLRPDLQASVI